MTSSSDKTETELSEIRESNKYVSSSLMHTFDDDMVDGMVDDMVIHITYSKVN